MYNINANNDKNEVAQKTAEFIDERICIISKELGSTERDLENFKRSAGITDLTSEAQIALTGKCGIREEACGESDSDKSCHGFAKISSGY